MAMKESNLNFEEISVAEIIQVGWEKKILIIVLSFAFAIFSCLYALSKPNIYTSDATLYSNDEDGNDFAAFSSLGGLSRLAGIDFDTNSSDKYTLAIRTISSREFLHGVIEEYDLTLDVMAVRSYDLKTGSKTYDETLWDVENQAWVRKIKHPYQEKPFPSEVREYLLDNFVIEKDNQTGFLFLSYTHPDPSFAKRFLDIVIKEINAYIREKDREIYKKNIDALQSRVQSSPSIEMTQAIYNLIESYLKKITLADTVEEYVLKVVDKPSMPLSKTYPFRTRMVITMSLMGGVFISFFIILFETLNRRKIFDNLFQDEI